MKIMVTGAAGFIGSHLVDVLIKNKHDVYAIDDLSGGFTENLHPKAHFHKLDLRKTSETASCIEKIKPELIYHLAADATEGRSQFTPLSSSERNFMSYMNLLVPAIANGVKKIILTSSMSVYGSQKPPFSEEMPRLPEDIYGLAKASMEKATEILSSVHGFKYVIVRPHNVYGPRQNMSDPYRNVIAIFINRLLQKKFFYIFGDGEQKRSFTYIDDCVNALYSAAFTPKAEGEIINIGPEKVNTLNEVGALVLKSFFDGQVPEEYLPHYVPLRPLEVKNAWCSSEKETRLLGLNASTPLEKGIHETVIWAKAKGAQKFHYLKYLEIGEGIAPKVWSKKLF